MDETVLEELRRQLRMVRRQPFEIALGDRGAFGSRRHARVVWLGVEAGREPLGELAAAVESACRTAGLPPEERPFRAHLTLARAVERGGSELPELPPPPRLAPWPVEEFVLYESRLGRGPAVYAPIERFELRP